MRQFRCTKHCDALVPKILNVLRLVSCRFDSSFGTGGLTRRFDTSITGVPEKITRDPSCVDALVQNLSSVKVPVERGYTS